MIRLVILATTLVVPTIVWAQPQRPERNVARSKATLAEALSEATWKDGELVATQGRTNAGDNGGGQYVFHQSGWSSLSAAQQAATGFYVRIGATDKYLEAIDKTVIKATQWGAIPNDGVDDTAALQAAIARWKETAGGIFDFDAEGFYEITSTLDFTGGQQLAGKITCSAGPGQIIFRNEAAAQTKKKGATLVWQGADNDGSAMVKIDGEAQHIELPALWGRYTDGSANKPTYGLWSIMNGSISNGGQFIRHLAVADCGTAYHLDANSVGNADRVYVEYFDVRSCGSGFSNVPIAEAGSQSLGLQFDRVQAHTITEAVFDFAVLTNTQVGQVILNSDIGKFLSFDQGASAISLFEVESMKIDPQVDTNIAFCELVEVTQIVSDYHIEFSNISAQNVELRLDLKGQGSFVLRDSMGLFTEGDITWQANGSAAHQTIIFERCRVADGFHAQDLISDKIADAYEHFYLIDCLDSNANPRPDEYLNNNTLLIEDDDVDIESGLIAHYQGLTAADDSSGNSNHGAWAGTAGYSSFPNGPGDAFGTFTTSNYVNLPANLSDGLTQVTIGGWIYPTSLGNFGSPFGANLANFNGLPTIRMKNNGTGLWQLFIGDGSSWTTNSAEALVGTAPPLNQWSYVAVVYDGTDAFIYQNGRNVLPLNATIGQNTTLVTATTNNRIGFGSTLAFQGYVADVKVWNRALSLQEVNVLSNPTGKTIPLSIAELAADPANPQEGRNIIWQSNGTGSGGDGDVLMKVTAGGSTVLRKLNQPQAVFATLTDALASDTLVDGDKVTTNGYSSTGIGGNEYIYHSSGWSGLSSPDGYGFYIRIGATDAYLEAIDKSIANAIQFGVDGSGDDSVQLQACFNAAQSFGADVHLPDYNFTASVSLTGGADTFPNVIGTAFKTRWFAPASTNWMLTLDATGVAEGKNLLISNVSFRDTFLAGDKCGVRLNMAAGPVRLENCDFRYLLIGCATNGGYALQLDSCVFRSNWVGLLQTSRTAANTMTLNSKTVTFSTPLSQQHAGISSLTNCDFSSNGIGWMFEDPDRSVAGAHLGAVATGCIFQGTGCTVWNRDVATSPGEPGITFNTCYWEATGSGTVSIDGSTVNENDIQLDAACNVVCINGSPNRVKQAAGTYLKIVGPGHPPSIHDKADGAICEVDNNSTFVLSQEAVADVVYPWTTSTAFGAFSKSLPKTNYGPLKDSLTLEKKYLFFDGETMTASGTGVTQSSGVDTTHPTGRSLQVTTTIANTGVQYLAGSTTNELWYVSFDIKGTAALPVRFIPLGHSSNISLVMDGSWQSFHWCGTVNGSDTRLRFWTHDTTGTFNLANVQVVRLTGTDPQPLFDFQRSLSFAATKEDIAKIQASSKYLSELSTDPANPIEGQSVIWQSDGTGSGDDGDVILKVTAASNTKTHYLTNRAPVGHAQISVEDNATATTVASTQTDWSAKSQFTGFTANAAESNGATPDHTNDHITITDPGVWEVQAVLTLSGSVASDLWELAFFVDNGSLKLTPKQGVNIISAGFTYSNQVTVSGLATFAENDTVELWVQRTNGTGTLTITNAVMTAKKVSD